MFELYVKNPTEIEIREVDSLQAPQDNKVKLKIVYLTANDLIA